MQQGLTQRGARFAIALVLTALASTVFSLYVSPEFVPIRVSAVAAEIFSIRHIIEVPLPDLSALRGQPAVLAIRLANARPGQPRVGMLRDGFPRARIVLPSAGSVDWHLTLTAEQMNGLAQDAGAGRPLELTGDADEWAVTLLELRNYRWSSGDRFLVAVVPREADTPGSGRAVVPTALVLALLFLLQAAGPRPSARAARLAGDGLAMAAVLTCAACLILPRTSPYTVLLSWPAFVVLAAALVAPLLVSTVQTARSNFRQAIARVTAFWARHPVSCERGTALFALTAIGVAQPIFSVVSNSPEFFTARGTSPVVAFAAVFAICLGVPLLLLGIERVVRTVSPRAATAVQATLIALLAAAIAMPALRRVGIASSPADVLAALLLGVGAALATIRFRAVRQFLTALSPAALVVPAIFLFDPSVAHTFQPSESPSAVQTVERTPPIVLVIFDELPLTSLLDAEENIDADRYPNFAALAREGHWFRNASTVSSDTVWAVPAILSGRYPTAVNAVPTLRYYPVNLFTTLGRHYQISASLRFEALCPPRACQHNSAMPDDTVRALLSDLSLVWLHIVGPRALTDTLPTIAGDWAQFGGTPEEQTGSVQNGRAGIFAQFLSSIDGRPARMHVLHLLLPHMAFEYVPSGHTYRAPDYQTTSEGGKPLFERATPEYADTLYQRHLAQVGFVDRLIGNLITRLREVGAYDETLLVVTADHGSSYREGQARRAPLEHNVGDIIQVPLFIKAPGQRQGGVVDRIAETVDILPTILDVVGAGAGLRLDGRSLIDPDVPDRTQRTFVLRDRTSVSLRSIGGRPAGYAESLDRKLRRFGSGDLSAVYAPPDARRLLGMNAREVAARAATDVQIAIRDQPRFDAVALNRDPLPLYVRGVLATSRPEPLNVAVVVNGVVAAVARSYRERGAHVFGTLIPESVLRDGNNTVGAFVVEALPVE